MFEKEMEGIMGKVAEKMDGNSVMVVEMDGKGVT